MQAINRTHLVVPHGNPAPAALSKAPRSALTVDGPLFEFSTALSFPDSPVATQLEIRISRSQLPQALTRPAGFFGWLKSPFNTVVDVCKSAARFVQGNAGNVVDRGRLEDRVSIAQQEAREAERNATVAKRERAIATRASEAVVAKIETIEEANRQLVALTKQKLNWKKQLCSTNLSQDQRIQIRDRLNQLELEIQASRVKLG